MAIYAITGNEFLALSVGSCTLRHQTRLGQFTHQSGKVDRNAPCPCGSGKKFKQCAGGVPRSTDPFAVNVIRCGATVLVNMRDIEALKEDDGFEGAFLSP